MKSEVKGWASSTQSKITQFLDQYLIQYPQKNVRESTQNLLCSLFKKGSPQQRQSIIELITNRLKNLQKMGKSSAQFLSLISRIFDLFPGQYCLSEVNIFEIILSKTSYIFNRIVDNNQYDFYSLCANMIDFGGEFKPYLLQSSGCLKCYGKPQVDFEKGPIANFKQEIKCHINTVEWILKNQYQINNLQISFIKKKLNYKSISLFYYKDNGIKIQLGKYNTNQIIPPINITSNMLGATFEFQKVKKNHITCILCSSAQEYAILCNNCVSKNIDIFGQFKIVGGSPEKISKQLSQSFNNLNSLRSQLENFAHGIKQNGKIQSIKQRIVEQMQQNYIQILKSTRLMRNISEVELSQQKRFYKNVSTECYSCHFYQFSFCLNFIQKWIKKQRVNLVGKQWNLIELFLSFLEKNKIKFVNDSVSLIISQLFQRINTKDALQHIKITKDNSSKFHLILCKLIKSLKNKQLLSNVENIKQFILNNQINKYFNHLERIELFVILVLSEQQYATQNDNDKNTQNQKLSQIKRLSIKQYQQYNNLLNFKIQQVLNQKINLQIKIFLSLIPQQYVPQSNLTLSDSSYLKFIKTVPPQINQSLIYSNIVFAPNPILKLNLFKHLPQIIKQLPLQKTMQVIRKLCPYRSLWNTHIRSTLLTFDKMLQQIQKQKRFMLCLQGYQSSKQNFYFQHIYKILTPQRLKFIIRLQIPQKQMAKQEKLLGGPVQYIYLPIRQVKSQDLKSDTIGGLHQWITEQMKAMGAQMPFDLIIQNNIIDNLDLSLQIVYKKIVQKQMKRTIGNTSYDFFRVIYRIQGIFGQANERNGGNPRDDNLQQAINYSSHLLTKLNCKKTGLQILMQTIAQLQKQKTRDKRNKIIKILQIIFKNQTIVQKIVQWQFGNYILNLATKYISLNKNQLKTTNLLLQMCSKVIDQANQEMIKIRKNSNIGNRKFSQAEMDIQTDRQDAEKAVRQILDKVKQAQQTNNKYISRKLMKILPFCSKDDPSASKFLFDYFQVNKIIENKHSSKQTLFLQYLHALSQSYQSFKRVCKQNGLTTKVTQIVISGLASIQNMKQHFDFFQTCLYILKSLIQGDLELQDYLFQKGTLGQIYKVGGLGTGSLSQQKRTKLGKIPLICFQIMKYFQEGKMISPQAHEYYTKNEQNKKQQIKNAKQKRLQMIKKKNQKAVNKFSHLMVQRQNEMFTCSSCKEGYGKKKQVLGVYLYSSKIQIVAVQNWWKDSKKIQSFTSTSYFWPIHLECHNQAMKDDLKIQKTQWDGAIIRNSQVLCNNWCAFKGPQTTDEEFDKVHRKYFQKNNKQVNFWVVFNDLNGLLEKFSKQYNFAQETKGSSYTHNIKLIPVLISFTCHLLKNNEDSKFLKQGMNFVQENIIKKPHLIQIYMCLLLFYCPINKLVAKKGYALKLINNLGYGNFKDSKPLYVYLALVESIVKLIHKDVPEGADPIVNLNNLIPKNFTNLIDSLATVAETYKNIYLKWQTEEEAKKYLQ